VGLVRRHPLITLGIGIFLLLTIILGLLIAYRPGFFRSVTARPQGTNSAFPYTLLLASTTTLATVSTASAIGMVAIVLARPVWCPEALCPPLAIEPSGTYDSNLAVSFNAAQGSTFVLSADPSEYSSKNLPAVRGPGAVVAQPTVSSSAERSINPYRLKIGVKNRKSTNATMLIESASMVIDGVETQASPTNVLFEPGQDEDLQGNDYTIVYRGERSKSSISAEYKGRRPGHVRLAPQEVDYLVFTVSGTTSARIRFRIRVDYRLSNESQTRTVTLGNMFTTVFADPHGWQPYQLANDRLAPA
jgi:hypothetical protein